VITSGAARVGADVADVGFVGAEIGLLGVALGGRGVGDGACAEAGFVDWAGWTAPMIAAGGCCAGFQASVE